MSSTKNLKVIKGGKKDPTPYNFTVTIQMDHTGLIKAELNPNDTQMTEQQYSDLDESWDLLAKCIKPDCMMFHQTVHQQLMGEDIGGEG